MSSIGRKSWLDSETRPELDGEMSEAVVKRHLDGQHLPYDQMIVGGKLYDVWRVLIGQGQYHFSEVPKSSQCSIHMR